MVKVIEVTASDLSGQTPMLFDHLEENLDVPALSVDADDPLVGQIDIRRQNGRPIDVIFVADEHPFARQCEPARRRYRAPSGWDTRH